MLEVGIEELRFDLIDTCFKWQTTYTPIQNCLTLSNVGAHIQLRYIGDNIHLKYYGLEN